jgi:hypothetical protein
MTQASPPQALQRAPARDPDYFPDFESVYDAIRSSSVPETVWSQHSAVLAMGINVFQPGRDAEKAVAQTTFDLSHSPKDYNTDPGDHRTACKELCKAIDLHPSQCLLLIRRWREGQSKPSTPAGWKPASSEFQSLRQFYLSQRWHLLLCQQAAVEESQITGTAILSATDTIRNTVFSATTIINELHSADFLSKQQSLLVQQGASAASEASNQLACELCLLLENLILLLSMHTLKLSDVADLGLCIARVLNLHAFCILDDHSSLFSLAVRCTTIIVLASMQCRYAPGCTVDESRYDRVVAPVALNTKHLQERSTG